MHFQTLTAALALAASGAFAQGLVPTDSVGFSVLSVLATAIPADSQSAAFANPSSFASAIASSISAGNLPAWYTGLPDDVKSILPSLYPVATSAVTSASSTPAPSSSAASVGTVSMGGNSTAASTFMSPTLSATSTEGRSSGSAAGASSTSASGNGAAVPTAVFGAGVAGAIGMLGMLAL